MTTDSGKVVLDIPRDRNGTFDPVLIAKYQRRFPEFDRKLELRMKKQIAPECVCYDPGLWLPEQLDQVLLDDGLC